MEVLDEPCLFLGVAEGVDGVEDGAGGGIYFLVVVGAHGHVVVGQVLAVAFLGGVAAVGVVASVGALLCVVAA